MSIRGQVLTDFIAERPDEDDSAFQEKLYLITGNSSEIIHSCEKLNTTQRFASVKHPQTNGQLERANRSLREGIKARLGEENKNWVEEVPHVLWEHHTTIKTSNKHTSFSLSYGTEAVIPVEIGMPSLRYVKIDQAMNDEALVLNLDILEEEPEKATIQEAKSKAKMEKYYNSKLGPKWEGPYEVVEALGKGAYKIKNSSGDIPPQTWNVKDLKKCYL
ncbi:reverse transcriptase domain-containing protein [Tanacetum coccineum]